MTTGGALNSSSLDLLPLLRVGEAVKCVRDAIADSTFHCALKKLRNGDGMGEISDGEFLI